jgi:hypothetical protein
MCLGKKHIKSQFGGIYPTQYQIIEMKHWLRSPELGSPLGCLTVFQIRPIGHFRSGILESKSHSTAQFGGNLL